jgi:hypothetical protein
LVAGDEGAMPAYELSTDDFRAGAFGCVRQGGVRVRVCDTRRYTCAVSPLRSISSPEIMVPLVEVDETETPAPQPPSPGIQYNTIGWGWASTTCEYLALNPGGQANVFGD